MDELGEAWQLLYSGGQIDLDPWVFLNYLSHWIFVNVILIAFLDTKFCFTRNRFL